MTRLNLKYLNAHISFICSYELSWALVTYIGPDNVPPHYAGVVKEEDIQNAKPKKEAVIVEEEDREID